MEALSAAGACSSVAASLSSPGFTVAAALVSGVAMLLNHYDEWSRILFTLLAAFFVLSHRLLPSQTAPHAGIFMLSLVVSIRLVLTSLIITPHQLDESIRAIASAPLRTAAVSIAVGAWMGKQVTEVVSYRRRLAVLVLSIMPVAITTRWAGALRSGNYSAVDPAFMLTWFISPLLVSFYGALAVHTSSYGCAGASARQRDLLLEAHLAWLQAQLQRSAVKATLSAILAYLALVPMETALVRQDLPIFPLAAIF